MIEKTDKKTCNIKCPNIGRCKDGCSLDKVLEEVNKEAPKNTQTIYSEILLAIKQGENIFLTASAGCGKSYLLNSIRKNLPILTVTASTGIAALNIGGSTLHSALHIGLANKPIPILIKTLTKKELLDIQKIHFLAIDEISMISGILSWFTLWDTFSSVALSLSHFAGLLAKYASSTSFFNTFIFRSVLFSRITDCFPWSI